MSHQAFLKHRFRRLRSLKHRLGGLRRKDAPPSYHEIFEAKQLTMREVAPLIEQKATVEHFDEDGDDDDDNDCKASLPQYPSSEKQAHEDAASQQAQAPRFKSDIKPSTTPPAAQRTLVERAKRQLKRENELIVVDNILRNNGIFTKWEGRFIRAELSIVFLFIWALIYFEFVRVTGSC